ncbi:MAG: metallophosphoesterase family protein [Pseudomonadota bacterium]|nr:metallophosphoesterase family protein [Pseudomonadota bacterium]
MKTIPRSVTGATRKFDLREAGNLRLAMISDTHGELDEQVAAVVGGFDLVLHAGDICGAPVLEQLAAGGRELIAVRGNNDIPRLWPEAERGALAPIPEVVHIDLPGGRLTMEHGHRFPDEGDYHQLLREQYPTSRLIVYGHTHVRSVDQDRGPWVVNPGPCGRVRLKDGPSCVTLEVAGDDWALEMHHFPLPETAAG